MSEGPQSKGGQLDRSERKIISLMTASHGMVRGVNLGDAVCFKGIPYAEAPFGENRMRPSERALRSLADSDFSLIPSASSEAQIDNPAISSIENLKADLS